MPAEKALTAWARGARYAGSKDRAAVRDHVYDVLRQKRGCAALGGGESGRALMIGLIRLQRGDLAALFNGVGHSPAPLTPEESTVGPSYDGPEVPDWMLGSFEARFGADVQSALEPLKQRADVFLRVNLRKGDVTQAINALGAEGITSEPFNLADAALLVTEGARKVARSEAYLDGLVELQDAASQAAMEALEVPNGARVLDYCAGGGGKTLALAGRGEAQFFAHDANPKRMRDLPPRAERAGVVVECVDSDALAGLAPFDLVLCDVPCSGSGTWRRDPDAKWRFTPERLEELNAVQDKILDEAALLVAQGGTLAYATCSLLAQENERRIDAFLSRHADWAEVYRMHWALDTGADGFFTAHLQRQ
ncbi:RsmB/NOP family class I SAM-dependent RNA methyltransferase [Rhodobacteraceae bacterium D3-12]|nr:RsmB/NOP family class I SAM-dependent RNA methyltransferase [Rhodobacteraceae bacterium D3-12]